MGTKGLVLFLKLRGCKENGNNRDSIIPEIKRRQGKWEQ